MCAVLFICDFLSTLQWTHVHEVTIKLMLLIADTNRLQCILLIEINFIILISVTVSFHSWNINMKNSYSLRVFKTLLKSFQWQNWKHLPNYLYVALSYAFNRKIPSPIPDTRVCLLWNITPVETMLYSHNFFFVFRSISAIYCFLYIMSYGYGYRWY